MGITGQILGRWNQLNIAAPAPIGSYTDFTELFFELDYLRYRVEVSGILGHNIYY